VGAGDSRKVAKTLRDAKNCTKARAFGLRELMLLLRLPRESEVRKFLSEQQNLPFSYSTPGMTRGPASGGFNVDHNRVRLGEGVDTFARAKHALRAWRMFDLGWVRLFWPDSPIEVGTVVAVVVQHLGFWSLNACRIVDVIDEDGPIRKYGFAYGTLPDHMESGEELFSIEWRRDDDSVWYDILAFSKPRHLLARIGYPLSRMMQKRFAKHSLKAMLASTKAG
jgi:uncharacterized protein (UPF0548 family)